MHLIALLACKDPYATGTAALAEDGIHVTVTLRDLEEASIAGQRVTDGQTLVLPYTTVKPGYNSYPIVGEGLDEYSVVSAFRVSLEELLRPSCSGGRASARGAKDEIGLPSFMALDCAVEAGDVVVPVKLPEGLELSLDPGSVEGGAMRFAVLPSLLDQRVPTGGVPTLRAPQLEGRLVLRWPDGSEVAETVTVDDGGEAFLSWLQAAPASLDGQRAEAPKLALFESAGRAWFEGEGSRIGDVDVVAVPIEVEAPVPGERCAYTDLGGGAGFSLGTETVAMTYEAFDITGRSLGTQRFVPRGCPSAASREPGQTTMRVVPSEGMVRAWVKGFLET